MPLTKDLLRRTAHGCVLKQTHGCFHGKTSVIVQLRNQFILNDSDVYATAHRLTDATFLPRTQSFLFCTSGHRFTRMTQLLILPQQKRSTISIVFFFLYCFFFFFKYNFHHDETATSNTLQHRKQLCLKKTSGRHSASTLSQR